MAHLGNDLVLQIPRQYEEIVRPCFVNSGNGINWNVHAWGIASMFIGVTIDSEVEEISTDSTVVK